MKSIKLENWTVLPSDIKHQMANIAGTMSEAMEALRQWETAFLLDSPKEPEFKKRLYEALTAIENCGTDFVFFQ